MTDDIVKPLRITDHETETTYELDFDRESVKFAEERGFDVDNVAKYPQTNAPFFFFVAFRKNHGNRMPRNKTDELLERMGGLPVKAWTRLKELFLQAQMSNVVPLDDEAENPTVTVEIED